MTKAIEVNINKWKAIAYSWIGRIVTVKMSILPKHLQTQCNSCQIPVAFFFVELEQIILKLDWTDKRLWEPNNLIKEQMWEYQGPWVQTILQSYSNQQSEVLAQKQTYISVDQNKEPRNQATIIWAINLWKWSKNIQWGNALEEMVLGKLDRYTQKHKSGVLFLHPIQN